MTRPRLKPTYTVPEAAALLRRSERQVRRMLAAGLLRFRESAGGRRVSGSDLWALLRWGLRRAEERARAREDKSGSARNGAAAPMMGCPSNTATFIFPA